MYQPRGRGERRTDRRGILGLLCHALRLAWLHRSRRVPGMRRRRRCTLTSCMCWVKNDVLPPLLQLLVGYVHDGDAPTPAESMLHVLKLTHNHGGPLQSDTHAARACPVRHFGCSEPHFLPFFLFFEPCLHSWAELCSCMCQPYSPPVPVRSLARAARTDCLRKSCRVDAAPHTRPLWPQRARLLACFHALRARMHVLTRCAMRGTRTLPTGGVLQIGVATRRKSRCRTRDSSLHLPATTDLRHVCRYS